MATVSPTTFTDLLQKAVAEPGIVSRACISLKVADQILKAGTAAAESRS